MVAKQYATKHLFWLKLPFSGGGAQSWTELSTPHTDSPSAYSGKTIMWMALADFSALLSFLPTAIFVVSSALILFLQPLDYIKSRTFSIVE